MPWNGTIECVWNELREDTNKCDGTEMERELPMVRQVVTDADKDDFTSFLTSLTLHSATLQGFSDAKAGKEDCRHLLG